MSVIIAAMAANDIAQVATIVGELLDEISAAVAKPVFRFDLVDTVTRLMAFSGEGHYHVFIARCEDQTVGFVALYEGHALYAEGAFGTNAELSVRPAWRSARPARPVPWGMKGAGRT